MQQIVLDKLLEIRNARHAVAVVTHMQTGQQCLIANAEFTLRTGDDRKLWPENTVLIKAVGKAIRDDKSTRYPDANGDFFIAVYNPPKRMIIVGAVHIAQKLVPMAALAEFDVTIVDPRLAFATPDRFPNIVLTNDWPDVAMTKFAPDTRTAIITLTHDPKLDDPALAIALKGPAFYIGSLGSRRTHAARLERLQDMGFSDIECARIHGPIGLALGAKSPAEIAISIMAQVTQVLHAPAQPRSKN